MTSGARSENYLRTISVCDNGVRCETLEYSVAKALEVIFDDGSEHGGISSGKESELDRKLENPGEESR